MIALDRVSKSFGGVRALEDVSLELRPGTIVAAAGADGAGKSTLLKVAAGLARPDSGAIRVEGRAPRRSGAVLRRVVGYMPERSWLYPDLAVGETLSFVAGIFGVPRREAGLRSASLLERTGLAPFVGRRAGDLSGGMRQKLAFCAACLPGSPVLILDEPLTGIDPDSRRDLRGLIAEARAAGRAVLVAVADARDAEMADEIIYLKAGRALIRGPVAALVSGFGGTVRRLRPVGDSLDVLGGLLDDAGLRAAISVRGREVVCRDVAFERLAGLPWASIEEVRPSIEDLCAWAECEADRRAP